MTARGLRRSLRTAYRRGSGHGERGAIMMELLVSIAIFGVVAVGFLGALVTGYGAIRLAHDKTMAQSLTRTAMENIATSAWDEIDTDADSVTSGEIYDVTVHAEYVDSDLILSEDATQLKLITVTVSHHADGDTILETQAVRAMP